MNSLTSDSEAVLRLTIFIIVFLALAILEMIFPRRKLMMSKNRRWFTNIGMGVFNTVLIRVTIPLAGVGAALFAQDRNWGLLNLIGALDWVSIVIFLLLFDLVIYFQHRVFHFISPLWRLHRMHHTDVDYDVTTGNRFHPASILISTLIKLGLIFLMGPLPVAIVAAEVLLNITSMFNHSNIRISPRLDALLRYLIVTPDMHRVHHSVEHKEHNKNFGFNFPWWDRLFGTYLAQPESSHETMEIGIHGFQDNKSASFIRLLIQPFYK